MTVTPLFLCHYAAQAHTLAAGVATDIDIPAGGARAVEITLKNSGAVNAITALAVTTIPLVTPGGARSVATGIPLAAAGALTISITDEPCVTIRLTVTSTAGTTATVEAVGL
jgi:hypothetical protein